MSITTEGPPTGGPITILGLAIFRGAEKDENGGINGAEFHRVGLDFMGGCGVCNATLAAYNACPSKAGYWCCRGCVGDTGWTDVAQANHDIFGEAVPHE